MTTDLLDALGIDPGWQDQPLGRSGTTARERYPQDTDWLLRWTAYAQFLTLAQGLAVRPHEGGLAKLGDRQLNAVARQIGPVVVERGAELGRRLLDEVVLPVMTRVREQADAALVPGDRDSVAAREAVHAWWWFLHRRDRTSAMRDLAGSTRTFKGQDEASFRDRLWNRGLQAPGAWYAGAAGGWRAITEALDEALAPWFDADGTPAGTDPLDVLLPEPLARQLHDREAQLAEYRRQHSEETAVYDGIRESGRLELLDKALGKLKSCIDDRRSMLLLGPTSSGKSYLGRIAAVYAKRTRGRVIILLPIKALVTQAVKEWKEFLEGSGLEGWHVLPGSRDYPEHDDALIRGEFDVAVMIPEKLTALMANGMEVGSCGLFMVDEFQTISDQQRGPHLEMLLTRLRMFHARVPIIGLSATLTEESAVVVAKWLGIEPRHIVRAETRPVPLEQVVRSVSHEMVLQPNGTAGEPTLIDVPTRLRATSGRRRGTERDRALSLCLDLLHEQTTLSVGQPALRGDNQSVLCFVATRSAAETFAGLAQHALRSDDRVPQIPLGATNPFLGRFSRLDPAEAAERWAAFQRFPNVPWRRAVHDALMTGVGFHTARLEPLLRETIEQAYIDGIIRLLFATDTLKLGLNLPADAVVVSSLTTPAGGDGRFSVLDRDAAAQRLGRAGRLGITDRGRGFLLVPQSVPDRDAVEFAQEDLEGLAQRIEPLGPGDTVKDRALRGLCEITAVFEHYLRYRVQGEALKSQMDFSWFARFLLDWLRRTPRRKSREALREYVDQVFAASMASQEANSGPPAPQRAVELLDRYRLIGQDSASLMAITGLGRAVSRSGLPLEDAPTVSSLAGAFEAGAGELTLLWLATRSEHVRRSTTWISLRVRDVDREALAMARVIRWARTLVCDAGARAQARPPVSQALHFVEADEDLLGTGRDADDLRALLDGHTVAPSLDDITALLRASVLLLWMRGCSMVTIDRAIGAGLDGVGRTGSPGKTGEEVLDRLVDLHISDVRNLGENTSYVFEAAGELLGVRPKDAGFRKLEGMAEALALGVPGPLAPLVRLPLRATHRERVIQLVPSLAQPFESLADVVHRLSLHGAVRPTDEQQLRKWRHTRFNDAEIEEILALLRTRDERTKDRSQRLRAELRARPVPGADYTFGRAFDAINNPASDQLVPDLARLLRDCGAAVETVDVDRLRVGSRMDDGGSLTLRVVTDHITPSALAAATAGADVVLAVGGLGFEATAAIERTPIGRCVVVEPAVLIETLARLFALDGETVGDPHDVTDDGEHAAPVGEPLEEFSFLDVFGDEPADDFSFLDAFDNEPADGQPGAPGTGADGLDNVSTGHRIVDLLVKAPPLMSRVDAIRLIDGLAGEDLAAADSTPAAGGLR